VSPAVVLGLAALLSGAAFLLGAWIGWNARDRERSRSDLWWDAEGWRCMVHGLEHAELRHELSRRALDEPCAQCGEGATPAAVEALRSEAARLERLAREREARE
jgi:hypothetical protein